MQKINQNIYSGYYEDKSISCSEEEAHDSVARVPFLHTVIHADQGSPFFNTELPWSAGYLETCKVGKERTWRNICEIF